MRLLALDHFFEQDLESLRAAGGSGVEWRVIEWDLLRDEAMRVFPERVATGLEAYADPELEAARREYSQWLQGFLDEQFMAWQFDALVVPSDSFFYIRAAPAACHRLGVPFVVVQKETTASEQAMRDNPAQVRAYAPPIADRMTVCSERLREFWLRSGMQPEFVTVTGQPRFDYYVNSRSAHPASGRRPRALFLSYHVDAYHPSGAAGLDEPIWATLHRQTEAGLWELARGGWDVQIKPHPQQPFGRERERIREHAGELMDSTVTLVPQAADVRRLIVDADVVIGFQTTALFEAMMAERPIVYTGWDPEAERMGSDLVPFHEWGDILDVVREPDALVAAVNGARGRTPSDAQRARMQAVVHEQLGPVDGHASERALAVVRDAVEASARARTPEVGERRRQLAAARPPLRLGRRARRGALKLRRRAGALLGH